MAISLHRKESQKEIYNDGFPMKSIQQSPPMELGETMEEVPIQRLLVHRLLGDGINLRPTKDFLGRIVPIMKISIRPNWIGVHLITRSRRRKRIGWPMRSKMYVICSVTAGLARHKIGMVRLMN
jgi:hypothetical protein